MIPEARVLETIAVLSMIAFFSIGVGLFVMNRNAQNDEAQAQQRPDRAAERGD